MPDQAEVIGLVALMQLHMARARARFDDTGEMVLLPDQDRQLWDHAAIAGGIKLLEQAGAMRAPGPYQLPAAIAPLPSQAESVEATDWHQIARLSDLLLPTSGIPLS